MIEPIHVFSLVFTAVACWGLHLFFRDRREARLHETKLTGEVLAQVQALTLNVDSLDKHVNKSLENYKTTLVAVLENMRELVKETEHERKRIAGHAAATLLRPGKNRMPAP